MGDKEDDLQQAEVETCMAPWTCALIRPQLILLCHSVIGIVASMCTMLYHETYLSGKYCYGIGSFHLPFMKQIESSLHALKQVAKCKAKVWQMSDFQ